MLKKLSLALGLASLIGMAVADDNSGAYINLNSGFATSAYLPTGEWIGNLNAGYNFNRYFAVEGGYNIMAGSQFDATASTNIFDAAAKGTLPLFKDFDLYGRAGLGWGITGHSGTPNVANCVLCTQANNGNFMLGLAGAGASYELSKHFELHLEDTMYIPFTSSATGAINAVTFGVQYNF